MKKYRITVKTDLGTKRYKVRATKETLAEILTIVEKLPYKKDEDGYLLFPEVRDISVAHIRGGAR